MLLTKTEREILQAYVIDNMIKEQQLIRNLLDDPDLEQTFIVCMIEKKYKQAFELCMNVQNVWLNLDTIQVIIDYMDPTIKQVMIQYTIFQTNNFDLMYKLVQDKLIKVYTAIFE